MADKDDKRLKTSDKAHRGSRKGPSGRSIAIGVAAGLGAVAILAFGFSALSRRRG